MNKFNDFPEAIELKCFAMLKALYPLGCTYLYYMLSTDHVRYSFYSNPDWRDLYYQENLMHADPLKRIAESAFVRLLIWDQVGLNNFSEKRVMQAREASCIHHGLTLTCYEKGFHVLTLGTDDASHNMAAFLVKEQRVFLEQLWSKLRIFIHKELTSYDAKSQVLYLPRDQL